MDNIKDKKAWISIICCLFGIAACLVAIGLGLYSIVSHYFNDGICNSFVAIYSGVASGFCALLGVLITVFANSIEKKKESIQSHIPEIYIPLFYDIANVEYFRFYQKGENSSTIANNQFYFKNTDKTDFIINSVKLCFSDNSEITILSDISYYVCKNKLFCIRCCSTKEIIAIILNISSVDKNTYRFRANLEKKIVYKIEDH